MHFYDVTGRKPSLDTVRLLNYSHRLTRYTAFNKIVNYTYGWFDSAYETGKTFECPSLLHDFLIYSFNVLKTSSKSSVAKEKEKVKRIKLPKGKCIVS